MKRIVPSLLIALVSVACGGEGTDSNAVASSAASAAAPTSKAAPTSTASTTSTTQPTTPTSVAPSPLGWQTLDVDVWGDTRLLDATRVGDRTFVVACSKDGDEGSVWWSDDLLVWNRQPGEGCIHQIESSAFGLFTAGWGGGLWSADGTTWQALDLSTRLGFEYSGQLGSPRAVFVSPDATRVSLLFSAASEEESTIARLATTTDGITWELVEEGPADLFDNADVFDAIEGGDGLLAVGASPGGEFVPTAAVWTSPDGLDWRRVTPVDADYTDKVVYDITTVDDGFVAVGGDFFHTGVMTAWTSPDGVSWTRSPHPDEVTNPDVAQMTAHAVTVDDGVVWAAGVDFDASRNVTTLPGLWRSDDGGVTWIRVAADTYGPPEVPFDLLDGPDVLAVWPPAGTPFAADTRLFVPAR